MACFTPVTIKNDGESLTVKCNRCVGCIYDNAREWSIRCIHEKMFSDSACFITLTYNSDNLPEDGLIHYSDFQSFMKRLRRYFEGRKIRFFATGEYGERNKRPHFHAILFGVDFEFKLGRDGKVVRDRKGVWRNKKYCLYQSETLHRLWGKGFCSIGNCSSKSVAYVAKYQLYKLDESNSVQHIMRCSKGIGARWCDKYLDEVLKRGYIVSDNQKYSVPRYYLKRFENVCYKTATHENIHKIEQQTVDKYKEKKIKFFLEKQKKELDIFRTTGILESQHEHECMLLLNKFYSRSL